MLRIEPRLSMGFSFGMSGGSSDPIEPDEPVDILLIGDFSGRTSRQSIESLAGRAPVRIDDIDLDDAVKRLRPRIAVGGVTLEPRSLEDFHADALARLAPRGVNAPSAATPPPRDDQSPTGDGESAFSGLLGNQAASAGEKSQDKVQDAVSKMIAAAMGGAKPAPVEQRGSIDHAWLRGVLADDSFRATEAAWHAAHWFATRVETGDNARLFILDASTAEIDAALEHDAGQAVLSELFSGRGPSDPPGLVVLLRTFRAEPVDLGRAQALGLLASTAGVPVVAGIDPAVVGCQSIAENPDPKQWDPAWVDGATRDAWSALRASPGAGSLLLAAPRIMLRAPYGSDAEPTEIDGFREAPVDRAPDHESLCWAPGSLAVGVAIAAGLGVGGRSVRLSGAAEVDQLPMHLYTHDREQHAVPPAETWLTDRAIERLSDAGIVPVASLRHRDAVRVGPIRALAGGINAWWSR